MFRLLNINALISAFLFSFISFSAFSDSAGVVSVTAVQKQIPVLKGSVNNFVLEIDIEIKENATPVSLNSINLDISGTDIQNDIFEIAVFSRQHSNGSENLIQFGKPQKPHREMVFQSEQQLAARINRFVVSVRLKENAGILNTIKVNCKSLEIDNRVFFPENTNPPIAQRLGVALRQHNDDGVHTFRIPGLETTNKGTLIAVYDARHNDEVDLQEDVDVGMSRSTDGGKTWEPMKIIMDMGEWGGLSNRENGVGDPCILVDRQTETIWVAGLWAHGKPGQRTWNSSEPGLEPSETGQFLLVKSEDDGKTWGQPVNITQQVKNKNWQLMLQGPGKGITLKNGTLVFPAQFKDENRIPFATIIYSTDHGKTWKTGWGAKPETTEAQVIELSDGSLMLNMRDNRNGNEKSEKNGRAVMITKDLGETWTEHQTTNGVLPEPVCMASLIKEKFEVNGEMREVVFFSNPASKNNRDNMTIKASLDDGKTWPAEYQLLLDEKEGRGYSCLTRIDEKTLGILYESSQADLVFQAIPVDDFFRQKR
jgi:sialidase-1